jgi:hypothetical protein
MAAIRLLGDARRWPRWLFVRAIRRGSLVGGLEGDVLRILFVAHDRMKPENVLRRSRRSDLKND